MGELQRAVLILSIYWVASFAEAVEPYVPSQPSPLTERWRWHAQEALEGLSLSNCVEGEDGSIWFISDVALIHYDGSTRTEYPAPEGLDVLPCRGMVMNRQGILYLLLPGRIIEFKGGEWNEVFQFDGRYDMLFGNPALTTDDFALFGTPEGIVAVKDGEARVISTYNNKASFLLLDRQNNLWTNKVGTGQVYRYAGFSMEEPLRDDHWQIFNLMPESAAHISLAEVQEGEIWCISDHVETGIQAYDPKLGAWSGLTVDAEKVEKIHRKILVSPDGTVVIYGDKRILLVKDGEVSELILSQFEFPITSPFILSLSTGNMVIGGRRESTYIVDCSYRSWETFQGLNYFCSDSKDRQWFISYEGGIVSKDLQSGSWTSYSESDGIINTPLAMICTSDGKVWAAGRHDNVAALCIFSKGKWERFIHPELGTRISHQSLLETSAGAVLLGCGDTDPEHVTGTGGLLKYEVNGDQYTTTHYTQPRVPYRIVGIQENSENRIWVGGQFLRVLDDFKAEPLPSLGEFSNSWIDHMVFTDSGDVWIAQWGLGIHVFDGQDWVFSGDRNERLTNRVVAFHEDQESRDQIWVATSGGLFNLGRDNWVDAPLSEDLIIHREGGGVFQSPEGKLWINTSSRNWNFRNSQYLPSRERYGSSFRTVSFNKYDIFPETEILEFETVVHEPGMNHFSWTGSCDWSIAQTDELAFSYRIDGGEWSNFTKRTEVILERQRNGMHTFEVRSRTPYGQIDPTPVAVEFRVIPVLWKQPWFILTVALFLSVLIALVVIIVRQRIHHLLALEEYKLQFFTNISHELRTPLMVILGPLEALFEKVDETGKQHLEIAYRNARKLVRLLDQLLDFRKAALGKVQTHPQSLDLVLFAHQELETLKPLADQKGQDVKFVAGEESLVVMFDPKVMEVILDNLLSNAIKYTPKEGTILVNLNLVRKDAEEALIRLEVVDTGPGIPRRELEKVFDPFYQSDQSLESKAHSTGIGLSHTKSLVEAIGGKIYAQSPVSKEPGSARGTRFVVELKLSLESFLELPEAELEAERSSEEIDPDEKAAGESNMPLMVVVEDDDDIREFLKIEFEKSFEVFLAENGEEGLAIALERIPDMVVSDVMMPVMNGKVLCEKLKSDQRTSHIPVILLTALKSDAHQMEGLETGADEYITKPVNIALLRKRVENLLVNRSKVREFIGRQTRSIVINKDELPVNQLDKEFMAKFMDTIEGNLISETFDVEGLAERMFMSRMTLYRKVKAMTGQSPGSIIRTVRLKKAAQYLETGSWSVGQVIEKVGFMDMSHFSRAFKKEYGCTPTQYTEKYRN